LSELFSAVIARSVSDEAIQLATLTLDCFAALAMTVVPNQRRHPSNDGEVVSFPPENALRHTRTFKEN
jgi:hypothetical protein